MYQARLREHLLISRGLQLPSDSTCVLEAEPGKLDIKRHSFTLQTSEYDVMIDCLCRFGVIGDVIQKVKHRHDLIKAHVVS